MTNYVIPICQGSLVCQKNQHSFKHSIKIIVQTKATLHSIGIFAESSNIFYFPINWKKKSERVQGTKKVSFTACQVASIY